jgi:5-methylcytosine-specific restriction enzyme subunit McrC
VAVPIRNVYYLLCYAWDWLEARSLVNVDGVPGNRIENLLGKVMLDGVSHLIRRGLDRGYAPIEQEGPRVRGKILLSSSIARSLLAKGHIGCYADDFVHDIAHNQAIKAAMRELIALPGLDDDLRHGLRKHCRRLHDVTDVELAPALFRQIHLHRNVIRYVFLLNVCKLLARSFMPDQKSGQRRFRPFTASQQEMGLLFEEFVRNFLRREQDLFRVTRAKVTWNLQADISSDPKWLPEMKTDIVLTSSLRRVVIETKYYATPYQSRDGAKKVISAHLYQLLTYLSQLRAADGTAPLGMLLYASDGEDRRLQYAIGQHTVLIRTLNLNDVWNGIHQGLLEIVRELDAYPSD